VWGCVPAATDLGLAGATTPHSVQVEAVAAAIGPAPGRLGRQVVVMEGVYTATTMWPRRRKGRGQAQWSAYIPEVLAARRVEV
jgi:hypothetical protein